MIVSFLIFFIDKKHIKQIIGLFLISISLITIIISTHHVFKERFQNKIFNELKQNEFNINKFIKQTEYGKIYNSAYELFLEKKYLELEIKIIEFYVKKIIKINIHLKMRLKIQDVILTHTKFTMKFYQNMEYLA